MTFLPQDPLTESELDRLEEILAELSTQYEVMPLDMLQGFFCAIVSGPELIVPSRWLPEIMGGVEPESAVTHEFVELLMRFYNSVVKALNEGEELDIILYGREDDPDALNYTLWCDGYIYGTQMGETNWLDAAGEYADDVAEKMEIFFLLNGMMKEDANNHGEPWMTPAEEENALALAEEVLPAIVNDLHRFWRARRERPAPVRHADRKIGRNDPCPCGSGKKYKLCCGRDATLA
jgi:uncharacterized protein